MALLKRPTVMSPDDQDRSRPPPPTHPKLSGAMRIPPALMRVAGHVFYQAFPNGSRLEQLRSESLSVQYKAVNHRLDRGERDQSAKVCLYT